MKSGFACIAGLVLFTMLAPAQNYEFSPTFGISRPKKSPLGSLEENSDKKDDDTRLKAAQAFGLRVTLNTPGYWGIEGAFMRHQNKLSARISNSGQTDINREAKINVDFLSLNVLSYFMPKDEWWRPFLTVGVQTQRYGDPGFPEWTPGPVRTFGFNFGGGLKLRAHKHVSFRLDVRDYIGGKPYDLSFVNTTRSGGLLQTLEGSVGFSITF
jgi:hypothetical protein